jgi:hypothetical protein
MEQAAPKPNIDIFAQILTRMIRDGKTGVLLKTENRDLMVKVWNRLSIPIDLRSSSVTTNPKNLHNIFYMPYYELERPDIELKEALLLSAPEQIVAFNEIEKTDRKNTKILAAVPRTYVILLTDAEYLKTHTIEQAANPDKDPNTPKSELDGSIAIAGVAMYSS